MMLLNITKMNAQVLGYGNSTNPVIPDPSLTTGSYLYTDDTRARVINAPPPAYAPTFTIAIDNEHGTFAAGDEVLLIQMKGVNIGVHQNAIVAMYTSGSPSTLTLNPVDMPTGVYPGYNTVTYLSTERLQVIKINNYGNFTITDGVVACHPWDDNDGTGGILCMAVDTTLTINGGVFTAAASGYKAIESPVLFRGSNAGELKNSANNNASRSGVTQFGCAGSAGTVTLTGAATSGDTATPPVLKGAADTGTGIIYGTPNLNQSFIIGTPGYYTSGYGSGLYNAGGGGHGGDGAATGCNPPNTSGSLGNDGGSGGASGIGGNAGGGIYIKANTINVYTPDSVFFAYGADGTYGEDGGDGGVGGAGGIGGNYCTSCPSITSWNGQYGGWGDNGIGGDGGDGGDGGHPGTIWIAANSSIGIMNSNFNVDGGDGGLGGYNGFGTNNFTPTSINITNPCDGSSCTTYTSVPCNPQEIFCFLKLCQYATPLVPTTTITFSIVSSSATDYVIYDKATGTLTLYQSGAVVQSVTVADPAKAWLVFSSFDYDLNAFLGNVAGSDNGNCGTSNQATVWWTNTSTSLIFASFTFQGNLPYFELQNGTPNNGKRIYFNSCNNNYGPGSGNGGNGAPGYWSGGNYVGTRTRARKGTAAANGTIDLTGTNTKSNVVVVVPSFFKRATGIAEQTSSVQNLIVFPNPTVGEISLMFNSASVQKADVEIIDVAGKVVYKQTIQMLKGENKHNFKLDGVASGAYTLSVKTNDAKVTQQVIVK